MINPEALDLSALPSLPLSDRKRLPTTPCIYFAMSNGTVQYIGKALNPRSRWSSNNHHHYQDLRSDSCIAWLEVSDPDLSAEIEEALIDWFKPPLNIHNNRILKIPNSIETKQIIRGARKTLSIQEEDLEALKRLKRGKESLAVTLHRIVDNAEMYDAILKAGEAKS